MIPTMGPAMVLTPDQPGKKFVLVRELINGCEKEAQEYHVHEVGADGQPGKKFVLVSSERADRW